MDENFYKSFREQFIECRDSGNSFYEDCYGCGHKLIMCKKYGGQCVSKKCRSERINCSVEIKKNAE